MHEARTIALPVVCCVWPMHQTMVPGLFSCSIVATFSICASLTPQASSTLSGVHLAITSAFTASMP
ncbi:MAG: hypothetical protein BWX79_03118 [Alphaproteobacteria bacterium ADurb.Bin100]|nr:MAG: hypothetical protein BWX79_03118 [Alphaproteobacteria bacterium ADurb.Bin100]